MLDDGMEAPNVDLAVRIVGSPYGDCKEHNWLPAPSGEDFSLCVRAYWPKVEVTDGSWTPPPVAKAD
jgi:hypothetical protein